MSNLDEISEAIGYLRADVRLLRADVQKFQNDIRAIEVKVNNMETLAMKGKAMLYGMTLALGAVGGAGWKYISQLWSKVIF